MRRFAGFLGFLCLAMPGIAQTGGSDGWNWNLGFEVKANYRDSDDQRFKLRAPFPPELFPPGEDGVYLQTVDPGSHGEVSLVSLSLEASYGQIFAARAKVDTIDLYNRNPTSGDQTTDLDEAWVRYGQKPEGVELPVGTSFFVQAGKAPKMERVPFRLLESYGLATNAFNRFNDVQALAGGSIGRNVYWRAQYSNGNPVFFRDMNALAGDNGTREHRTVPPTGTEYNSGFPVLYDAEVEDYFFDTDYAETGYGVGFRWQSEDQQWGFDVFAYGYDRDLAETVELEGTFYGGDLDLLVDAFGTALPFSGDEKTERGARLYAEWKGGTILAQHVEQDIANLERSGDEIEIGWRFPLAIGQVGGKALITFVQPAVRYSELDNDFTGPRTYVAPSVWWDWTKTDVGVRIGLMGKTDLTIERAVHDITAPVELDLDETLVTLRFRI